jgi:hypothetical protein
MTCIFGFWYFLQNKSESIIVGGSPESKNIKKNLLQGYNFFIIFCLRNLRAESIQKSQVTYDLGHGK